MPNDPDFHNCAAAWLDATGDDSEHRVLREILRDSPGATEEFTALARAESALQLAGLTPSERLSRARKLIEPSLGQRLRRLIARPAVRWAAAAALLIGGLLWLVQRNEAPLTRGKPRIGRAVESTDSPGSAKSRVSPDKLPPADHTFAARMGKFIVPEFRATRVPLAVALDTLGKNVAAIDATAVPEFPAPDELPEGLTVNLHLKFQPVAVLVDLIGIQTGARFRVAGKGYAAVPDDRAPRAGEEVSFRIFRYDSFSEFLQRQGLSGLQTRIGEHAEDAIDAALGEKPVELQESHPTGDSTSMAVNASRRLHNLLEHVLTPAGTVASGAWGWSLKVVELSSPATQSRFARLVPEARARQVFAPDEFQTILRELSGLEGVDVLTLPPFTPAPGITEECLLGTPSLDPINDPEGWTGIHCRVRNRPAGDVGGQFTVSANLRPPLPGPSATVGNGWVIEETGEIEDGGTMLLFAGNDNAVFLTGHSDPARADLPAGIPVAGRKGFVRSPYSKSNQLVDVSDLPSGTKVKCPYSGKLFRVP